MKYQLVVRPQARADFDKYYIRIVTASPEGAQRWFVAFTEAIDLVLVNPFQFGIAAESKRLKIELREKLFKTRAGHKYRIVYLVEADIVNILRIRGKGQAPLRRGDIREE